MSAIIKSENSHYIYYITGILFEGSTPAWPFLYFVPSLLYTKEPG
jgi:hypothetical protein